MSEILVRTHFADVAELAEGLLDRVDGERLMLYGPDSFEEGESVAFEVLLVDGTAAIEGRGRVATTIDGGEERGAETRYDVVLDSLELAGASEVVYERIVIARQASMGEQQGPATSEVDLGEAEGTATAEVQVAELDEVAAMAAKPMSAVDDAEVEAVSAEELRAEYAGDGEPGIQEQPAVEVDDSELADVAFDEPEDLAARTEVHAAVQIDPADASIEYSDADVQMDSSPPALEPVHPTGLRPPDGQVLVRPSRAPAWAPSAVREQAATSAQPALFNHGPAGLPLPEAAPHPDLDASQRIDPAPRPPSA